MKAIFPWLISALLFFPPLHAFAAGWNLCGGDNENGSFLCPLQNKKFVAVCTLFGPFPYPVIGHSYRYGTAEHIEISLPEDPKQFREVTSVYVAGDDHATKQAQFIRFANRQFSYVIYDASRSDGFAIEGVAVFDGQKLLRNTHCTSPDNDLRSDLQSDGMREEEESQARLFWRQILPAGWILPSRKPGPGSKP